MMIKSRMGVSADGFVSTFLPALGAPQWPWSGLQVYVLTSSPPPAGTEGLPLSPQRASPVPRTLLRADRTFPDGSAELVCPPA